MKALSRHFSPTLRSVPPAPFSCSLYLRAHAPSASSTSTSSSLFSTLTTIALNPRSPSAYLPWRSFLLRFSRYPVTISFLFLSPGAASMFPRFHLLSLARGGPLSNHRSLLRRLGTRQNLASLSSEREKERTLPPNNVVTKFAPVL